MVTVKLKGSDLHLKVNYPPSLRLAGVLRQLQLPKLTAADMDRLMLPLLSPRQRTILDDTGGIELRPPHLRRR